MVDRSQIDEIKSKLSITDVVKEYVPTLKKAGRNYFALCPFHNEKTPSFSVNEELQLFKCFGCGQGGDAIKFIELIEGIDFPNALEVAAKKTGVTLSKGFANSSEYNAKEAQYRRLLECNQLVANYYHFLLTKHTAGKEGMRYAKQRKLTTVSIQKFLIGYAPKGYNNLKIFLAKHGFKESELIEWSLLVSKNNRVYDKFRNRLMFPIFNHLGDIVGFSGRVIEKDDIPKYLNSSQTMAYDKSNILYGLYQAKSAVRKNGKVIIVEGNVDIPTAHQYGVENIVAPMGTALTDKQLKLLKRYADTILFALDSDVAGETALLRVYELAVSVGFKTYAIDLKTHKDLDEFFCADPEFAKKAIDQAQPVIEHLINKLEKRYDFNTGEGKSRFVNLIVPLLTAISDNIEQAHYVQTLATRVRVDEDKVWDILSSQKSKKLVQTRAEPDTTKISGTATKKNEGIEAKEKFIIAMLLEHKFLQKENINWKVFGTRGIKKIYNRLKDLQDYKDIRNIFEQSEAQIASDIIMMDVSGLSSPEEARVVFAKHMTYLRQKYLLVKIEEIKHEMQTAESNGSETLSLIEKLSALTKELNNRNIY